MEGAANAQRACGYRARMAFADPEIRVADVGERTTVVSVHGELDLDAADHLREALQKGDRPGHRVVLDLVGATFVDSTALGIISGAAKQLDGSGGSLTVVASDPRIIRIFKLTGLDRRVRVESSLAEAIAQKLLPA
jgi:anti-sigma B factor antagonist